MSNLDGLVIARRSRVEATSLPVCWWSTIRLSQGDRPVADIEVRDPEGDFPVGKRLAVSLDDAA